MTQQFAIAARQFVEKAIRMRKAMLKEGQSKMNKALAAKNLDELELLLKTYKYNTNDLMVNFWRRKKTKILEILPGANSRAHRSMISEFNQLDVQSQYLMQ